MEATQKPFTRKKPDQLVYLELGSGNGGMLLSISEDGFRFRAVSPLRPQGLMPFAFSFDGNQRMQGVGEVEWIEDDGKSGGMRFVEVSPDFRSALEQWLAFDPPRGRSGREATPAAATPLDTMEKIREELRRGYPQAPAKPPARPESPEAPENLSPPKHQAPARKPPAEPRPQSAKPVRETAERSAATNRFPEPATRQKEEHQDLRNASEAPAASREQEVQPAQQPDRPSGDRGGGFEPRSRPFYPPPFTHPAESEPAAPAENASSAFLNKPAPPSAPDGSQPRSAFSASEYVAPATPVSSEPSRSREEANVSAETLRRPFRGESRPSRPERPYVPPPVDESFETAWERAKLTAPPESPHLSRAAAGSIIGFAMALILGALAFNFRQDIGELVIDLGQKISGGNHAAPGPSAPASENKPESQTAANPSGPASAAASDKPDTPPSQTAPAQNTGGTNSPMDTRTAGSPTQHDASSGAAHDANPIAPRHAASSGTTSNPVPNGTVSPSGGATTGGGAPAGSMATTIGTEPGSGQDEFNAAREMLKGDHRHRDLSRAVDLLWAGVRKGYVPAEVTLADLYRRGDGVAKNCDQAQVLLVAASKKGSPEARQLLELMAEQGCSD
jgi:hypothetical protein